jgi:hypothetical protein
MSKISSRHTPINDSNPLCNRILVTLCIYVVDPDLVTQILGIQPTLRQKKGVLSLLPSGKEEIGRMNSWLFSTEKFDSLKDIRSHLDWILDKIEPTKHKLEELQNIPGTKMYVLCNWLSKETDAGAFALWPEQMERLARLNLELFIEVLCAEKEEEI